MTAARARRPVPLRLCGVGAAILARAEARAMTVTDLAAAAGVAQCDVIWRCAAADTRDWRALRRHAPQLIALGRVVDLDLAGDLGDD